MLIHTAAIIISSTTITLSPINEPEIFYLDDDYSLVAKEYMKQRDNDTIDDINDILYKTIGKELSEPKDQK